MAQHTRQQKSNASTAQPETAASGEGGRIAKEAFPAFQALLEGLFNQVGQHVASQPQAQITAITDQQQAQAQAQELRELNKKFEQFLKGVNEQKSEPPFQKVLRSIMDVLGVAEGKHRKANDELNQGNLKSESVEEFRNAFKMLVGQMNDALGRIEALEQRADYVEGVLEGHDTRLSKVDETLAAHRSRVEALEQGSDNEHLAKLRQLLGYVPSSGTADPARLTVVEGLQGRIATTEQGQQNLAAAINGLGAALGVDPDTGQSQRLNRIETELDAAKQRDLKRQEEIKAIQDREDAGISLGKAGAIGAAVGVISFLIAITLFGASFSASLVMFAFFGGITWGVVYAVVQNKMTPGLRKKTKSRRVPPQHREEAPNN